MPEIESQEWTEEDLEDFRYFTIIAFHYLNLPSPTRLQLDVCWWLQHGPNRLILECFRGFGKSLLLGIYAVWKLYHDRNRKVLYTSASGIKSSRATQFILGLIRLMPFTRHLGPGKNDRSSSINFDVPGCDLAQDPSVAALGIRSNAITGSRSTDTTADDVESKENSRTVTMRESIREVCRELGGALARSEQEVANTKVCYLGTPQVEESLYHSLADIRGPAAYKVLIYPARYPSAEEIPEYRDRLAPMILEDLEKDPSLAGEPTEPDRFNDLELLKREGEYGRLGFLLQFMLAQGLSSRQRFALLINDLVVMDLDADLAPEKVVWSNAQEHRIQMDVEGGFTGDFYHAPAKVFDNWQPYEADCMAIDISGRGKDELGFCAAKTLNSQIFVLEVGGYLKGTSEETMVDLAKKAKRWGIKTFVVEENFGDGMWTQLMHPILRKYHPEAGLTEIKSKGQKELRIIEALGGPTAQHRLIINRSAIEQDSATVKKYLVDSSDSEGSLEYQWSYQYSHLTSDRQCLKHDDRLDAMAMAAQHFTDMMSLDQHTHRKDREAKEYEETMEEWLAWVEGKPTVSQGWIDE